MSTTVVLWAVAGMSLIEAFAQIMLKTAAVNHAKSYYLAVGAAGYVFVSGILYWTYLKRAKLGSVNVAWNSMSAIAMFAAGYFFFGESMTAYDWLGLLFGVLSIYFINHDLLNGRSAP